MINTSPLNHFMIFTKFSVETVASVLSCIRKLGQVVSVNLKDYILYIPWLFPPFWGVADNTKKQQKQWGFYSVLPKRRGTQPSLDGTAGATQPILPRVSQLTSLHRCHLSYCPYHRVASIRQPHGNSRCQSELRHNYSPLISISSTLTYLPHIHPCIIQGSLYSIHPPKPRPPSSTSPVNLSHSLSFSAVVHCSSSPHDRTISKHSYLL